MDEGSNMADTEKVLLTGIVSCSGCGLDHSGFTWHVSFPPEELHDKTMPLDFWYCSIECFHGALVLARGKVWLA